MKGMVVEEQGRLNNYAIEPQVYVAEAQEFGFTRAAERLNGRLAMLGFVSLLLLEVLTGHGLTNLLAGLR
jgi:hypothetical protein